MGSIPHQVLQTDPTHLWPYDGHSPSRPTRESSLRRWIPGYVLELDHVDRDEPVGELELGNIG